MNVMEFFTNEESVWKRLNMAMMVAFPAELIRQVDGEHRADAIRRQVEASRVIRRALNRMSGELLAEEANGEWLISVQPTPDELVADFNTPEPAAPAADYGDDQHADNPRCPFCGERHG